MAIPAREPKSRITVRVTPSVVSMLEEAAALSGMPLDSFLVSAAVGKAGNILARERKIRLTSRDAECLSQLMENPPEPNARLLAAATRFKSRDAE